jgi:hypothetical protein
MHSHEPKKNLAHLNSVATSSATYSTVWQNPQPSSIKYCQPIMFDYVKETEQIKELQPGKVKRVLNLFVIAHLKKHSW